MIHKQARNRIRPLKSPSGFNQHEQSSEWVEACERTCCCGRKIDPEEHNMSVYGEVTLTHPGSKHREITATADDCGETFTFAKYTNQSEDSEEGRELHDKSESQAPGSQYPLAFRVCFPLPPLRACKVTIDLIGLDGFKKAKLGSAECNLANIFSDKLKEHKAWKPSHTATRYKHFSLDMYTCSKGVHHHHFAGIVQCRLTLTENEFIVDFVDAEELRDLNVPLDVDAVDTKMLYLTLGVFSAYFLFGTIFFACVPRNSLSNAPVDQQCINVTVGDDWQIQDTGPSPLWEAPSFDRLITAFYFSAVVFTSVGFGDIIVIGSLRIIMMFFVLWGTAALLLMISLGSWAQEHMFYRILQWKHNICKGRTTNKATVHAADKEQDRDKDKLPSREQSLWLEVGIALVTFFLLIIVGMSLYLLEKCVFQDPDPSVTAGEYFVNALYFSVIACGTIGFGDETPSSTGGKLIFGIFLLFALPVFGNAVAVLASVASTRRQLAAEAKVLAQYGPDLDADELRSLIHSSGAHGSSCTRSQFILTMLLKQNKISPSDIKHIGNSFDFLDKDRSGYLGPNDVTKDALQNKTKQ